MKTLMQQGFSRISTPLTSGISVSTRLSSRGSLTASPGPSSNHAFFRSVSRCFFHFLRSAPLQHDQSQLLTTAMLTDDGNEAKASTASHMASLENPFLATLPAMSESLLMLDRFFATTAPILPFIAKATLITSLRELTSGSCEPGSWTKRALVNIAFAHSCMVVGDIRSDIFFRRSLHCVISETLRGANIRLIQALLLVTSYQQQQQMSVKSWTYHALAVKAAFQLGLHCPSSYKEISPSDAELSKRLWYCLINQDRMLCMCLGRPCLIPSHYICTPRLEDPNSTCRISSIGHDYQTESLLHHKYQTDLYCIVASVLSDMYQHNIEREESLSTWTLLATRLKLFHLFEEWNRKLDPGLELITPQEVSTILSSQRVEDRFRLSLTMHYYRALILLNGPVLTQVLDIAIGSSHTNAEAVPFVEHCLPTLRSDFVALENMHQILSVLSQSEDFLNQNNMWWLCNHASSSVAMHLFCLALLYQVHPNLEVLIGIPAVKIRQVLGECLDNMRLLQRTSVLFRRAREAIHRFTQKLDSVSSVRERNTPSTVVSDIARPFDFDFTQYDLSTTNDLLGQSDLDLLLGDGLYC
ncbi:uncharacterized protein M421DRAFT_379949 [Didymella exigua CBS 183.55]|uniref:Xylanolytic transcriptional activator regulatory domain-containing protein n=1 Tax=Didymella exigua CBS 183.55 TaxID=1150837 RepID=A0A6A5R512_9PLEO|nr:uncharacterized protein M421DRAFT_379949 [Didymella exigua CBS 183.55]KAF1922260.1 hypothetical protein M421DRAFT_379949 [Didymella exigua CBS 183.55]